MLELCLLCPVPGFPFNALGFLGTQECKQIEGRVVFYLLDFPSASTYTVNIHSIKIFFVE